MKIRNKKTDRKDRTLRPGYYEPEYIYIRDAYTRARYLRSAADNNRPSVRKCRADGPTVAFCTTCWSSPVRFETRRGGNNASGARRKHHRDHSVPSLPGQTSGIHGDVSRGTPVEGDTSPETYSPSEETGRSGTFAYHTRSLASVHYVYVRRAARTVYRARDFFAIGQFRMAIPCSLRFAPSDGPIVTHGPT